MNWMKPVALAALMVGVAACSEGPTTESNETVTAEAAKQIVSFEKFQLENV